MIGDDVAKKLLPVIQLLFSRISNFASNIRWNGMGTRRSCVGGGRQGLEVVIGKV